VGSWKDSILKAKADTLADINRLCYDITWELFTQIVKFTPSPTNPGKYAKGLLANQWYPQEGSSSLAKSSSTSPNGANSLDRINALAKNGTEFYMKDGIITMTNNSGHAYRAEVIGWPAAEWRGKDGDAGFGGGGKPYRMVARSLILIKTKYPKL
jgi:hypothetical protein